MFNLSRQTDYALVALATLAEKQASAEDPLSAAQIAEKYGFAPNVIIKVMKVLQRGGLIRSTRGARGGYYLAHSPAWITLLDVIEAMEGPTRLLPCCTEQEEEECMMCGILPDSLIGRRMKMLNDRVESFFRHITLRDLLATDGGVESVLAAASRTAAKPGNALSQNEFDQLNLQMEESL